MTEEQQKAADDLIKVIESFWGPVVKEVTRRTGWSPEQIWSYEAMGSIQAMERSINALMTAYNGMAQKQQEMLPKHERLLDASLDALESMDKGEDWKKDVEQKEGETDGMAT